jgi:hypothetical protein
MTEKRKPPNAGVGRVKGVPNKATRQMRLAVSAFLEQNTARLNHLLDEIERTEGPLVAFETILRLMERHMPPLRIRSCASLNHGKEWKGSASLK